MTLEIFYSRGRINVLRVLTEKGELNIFDIALRAGLNNAAALPHLKRLCELGKVHEKRFGRIRIFHFKKDDPRAWAI